MFKEILKIIPSLNPSDLNNMEKALSKRFTNVAKKFGKGMMGAIKGGGIAAAAVGLIDKLLNPLKETQEAIERSLSYSDDLVANAKQFNTTAGNLAKLQAYGQSTGLDSENLNMLLAKFQTSVAEAVADPTKKTSVRNFTGEKDTAKAFFEFIQALKKMETNQQVLVQQEVFGEKQILRMADFLATDFKDLAKFFKGVKNEKITAAANKLGDLKDYGDSVTALRNLKDIQTKGGLINKGTVNAMENSKAIALKKENERIANFQAINNVNDKMNKISSDLEKLCTELFTQIPAVLKALDYVVIALKKSVEGWAMIINGFKNSRIFRGLFGSGE